MALLLYIFTLIVILVHVMFVVLVKALGNQSWLLFEALQTWATGLTYTYYPVGGSGRQQEFSKHLGPEPTPLAVPKCVPSSR